MPRSAKKGKTAPLHFEPTAYIQRLLGRELISNESIALAELVKNAYDAGAKEVTITLHTVPKRKMVVTDNGNGMSLPEFRRLWMRPGYSEKADRDPKSKRTLLGEKGIGRFAADKLAKKLIVFTKKKGEADALRVSFDWEDFNDRSKDIRKVNIYHDRVRDLQLRLGVSGTRLELEQLRSTWTPKDWAHLRRELKRLIVPSGKFEGFKIFTNVEGQNIAKWETGEVKSNFIPDTAYKFVFTINKQGNIVWSLSRPKHVAEELGAKTVESGTAKQTNIFGFVSGTFYYLENGRNIGKQGYVPGIGVYRDGFVVEPYGGEDDDWLESKYLKASRQGHAPISPSKLFGWVEITRSGNPKLKDVTNREGIQESMEFTAFRSFVVSQFRFFANTVGEDKQRSDSESESYKAQRSQQDRAVRATTFAAIADQLAHQLRQPLTAIGYDAQNLVRWMEKKGINDKFIVEATDSISRSVKDINDHITLMRSLSSHYKNPTPIRFNLCELIGEKLESLKHQEKSAGIQVDLEGCNDSVEVSFSREALGFLLDNLLQNAINALQGVKGRVPNVRVVVESNEHNQHTIQITDNGNGVPKEYRDRILKENVPSRTGGTGFGLLYCRNVVEETGGTIAFESQSPFGTRFVLVFEDQELPN
jgi:signal transduction histidine kinase